MHAVPSESDTSVRFTSFNIENNYVNTKKSKNPLFINHVHSDDKSANKSDGDVIVFSDSTHPPSALRTTRNIPGRRKKSAARLPIPHTAAWILHRLRHDGPEEVHNTLRLWTHTTRRSEVDDTLVAAILSAEDDWALTVIRSLREPRRFVRKVGARQLMLPTILHRLDNGVTIQAKALIDSGCTGSCIDKEFVQKHKLLT